MITSNANRDSFHALNPNSNLNANPTYICLLGELNSGRKQYEIKNFGGFKKKVFF